MCQSEAFDDNVGTQPSRLQLRLELHPIVRSQPTAANFRSRYAVALDPQGRLRVYPIPELS